MCVSCWYSLQQSSNNMPSLRTADAQDLQRLCEGDVGWQGAQTVFHYNTDFLSLYSRCLECELLWDDVRVNNLAKVIHEKLYCHYVRWKYTCVWGSSSMLKCIAAATMWHRMMRSFTFLTTVLLHQYFVSAAMFLLHNLCHIICTLHTYIHTYIHRSDNGWWTR